jgi:3'(2'), 5'-bisphosphate nucleotidase
VESILEVFPNSGFVAEEDDQPLPRQGTPMWVVDPIDGTSQFVDPSGREYCSVVCRLDEGIPTGAYVLAPELGAAGSPISIHWADGHVTVNGKPAVSLPRRSTPGRASVTRSKNSPPRPYENVLESIGSQLKLRTTSQTVDMIRTCLDLSEWTGTSDAQFDLFYRRDQKLWDGAAGIGLAGAMGRLARTGSDEALFPVTAEFLARREPTFAETVAGDPESVRWFLDLLRTEAAGGE